MRQYQLIQLVTLTVKHYILTWPLIDDILSLSIDGNISISGLQVLPNCRKLPTVGTHEDTSKTSSNFIVVSKVVFNMLVYVTRAKKSSNIDDKLLLCSSTVSRLSSALHIKASLSTMQMP